MIEENNASVKSAKIIKLLQIVSPIIMLAMVILCLVFLNKNNISVKNVDALAKYLTGEPLTVALIIIVFSIVKSFSLVFPPAILYVLSGLVFENLAVAILVNVISSALSVILPYYLGRFLGLDAMNYLKGKFKPIKKLEKFTDTNTFSLVFFFRAGGIIPLDLASLVFGVMGLDFKKYYLASNLGSLILSTMWTLIGAKADLSNPLTYLLALPMLLLGVISTAILGIRQKRKEKS